MVPERLEHRGLMGSDDDVGRLLPDRLHRALGESSIERHVVLVFTDRVLPEGADAEADEHGRRDQHDETLVLHQFVDQATQKRDDQTAGEEAYRRILREFQQAQAVGEDEAAGATEGRERTQGEDADEVESDGRRHCSPPTS